MKENMNQSKSRRDAAAVKQELRSAININFLWKEIN